MVMLAQLAVVYSLNGRYVYTGSHDGMIRCWDISVPGLGNPGWSAPPGTSGDTYLSKSSWVMRAGGELLFWVPPSNRAGLHWPRTTILMGPHTPTILNFLRYQGGTSWAKCRTVV